MKTGIMQTGLSHPARLESGWDLFTGEDLTGDEICNLLEEGWELWSCDPDRDRDLWIRPTPHNQLTRSSGRRRRAG